MNFDLSRKINGLQLGSTIIKNSYLGGNKVKEVYLGNNILYINDHLKLRMETSGAYISSELINEASTYINVTLKDKYSRGYVYINFLNENNGLYTETNTQTYTITKINTNCYIARYTPPFGLTVYTTTYMNYNETRKLTYFDVYSKIYPGTKLHRYCIQCIRKPSSATPATTQSFDYNVWIAAINNKNALYSFSVVGYKPSTNTYHLLFAGGGSNGTIFDPLPDTYLRYRHGGNTITAGTIYVSYLTCVSENISVYYSNNFNTAWNIIKNKDVNQIKNNMQLFSNTPEQHFSGYKYVATQNFILSSSVNICVTDK